jgi:hypothetical protein
MSGRSDQASGGQSSGRFKKGRSGNPNGRPRKAKTVNDEVRKALAEKVAINENGRRRRVTKLAATAKQLVNKGAGGDPRVGKLVLELAQKAEDAGANGPAGPLPLTEADEAIVQRFLDRQYLIWKEQGRGPDDAG